MSSASIWTTRWNCWNRFCSCWPIPERALRQPEIAIAGGGRVHLTLIGRGVSCAFPSPPATSNLSSNSCSTIWNRSCPASPSRFCILRAVPTAMRFMQHDLFTIPAPEPERLESTLQKIRAMVGPKNVKVPEIRNTYRPGWGQAETNLAFRHFRPPLEVRVEVELAASRPSASGRHSGNGGRNFGSLAHSGRLVAGGAWDRDEFDLALSDGALYQDSIQSEVAKVAVGGGLRLSKTTDELFGPVFVSWQMNRILVSLLLAAASAMAVDISGDWEFAAKAWATCPMCGSL